MRNDMSHERLRRCILLGSLSLVILILFGVFVLKKRSEERDYIYSITTMSIERVTAKYEKDGAFYLTVVLDDF